MTGLAYQFMMRPLGGVFRILINRYASPVINSSPQRRTAHKLLILLLFTTGCEQKDTLYKAYEDIEDGQWFVEKKFDFQFEVSDTTQAYNLYYLVRNAQQYPYYNLYLNRVMRGPDGKVVFSRLDEMYLSDEVTGKPRGSGLGDLFDHKFVFQRDYRFPKPGNYTLTVTQAMRQDPLPFVLGIGLSVEKVSAAPAAN